MKTSVLFCLFIFAQVFIKNAGVTTYACKSPIKIIDP
jgi:hypothetical protein